MKFPSAARALNSRNYRLFFSGQSLSLMGNWMTLTASSWLAYELSGSATMVGVLVFANQIPVLLFGPFGGLWGDRVNRKNLLTGLLVACSVQSTALAAVTISGHLTIPWLLGLTLVRGCINALEFPTRQSLIVELVDDKADLPNAIALNASLFNVARLVGPTIAGVVIAAWGAGNCYLLDAISYIAIIGSLLAMRVRRQERAAHSHEHPWTQLVAGVRYVRDTAALKPPLIMVPMAAMTAFAANLLAPVFARDVFGGTAITLGNMYSAMGAGALVSAFILASRKPSMPLAPWVVRGGAAVAISQCGFALSPWLPLSLVCLMVNGFGTVFCMAGNNTIIQSQVEDDKRSRVMGLFAMGQGMFPIGSLIIGFIAGHWGPRTAVGVAAVCMAGTTLLYRRNMHALRLAAPPQRPAPLPSDSTA